MLKIRLRRVGKKNYSQFRIIVQEHTRSPKSSFIEAIGTYNPQAQPSAFAFDEVRTKHWLGVGAQMSPTVQSLWDRHTGKQTKPLEAHETNKGYHAPTEKKPKVKVEEKAADTATEASATEAAPTASTEPATPVAA